MPASEVQSGTRMELKYCERCGGLWLRPKGSGLSYCAGCAAAMAELPGVRLKTPAADKEREGRRP